MISAPDIYGVGGFAVTPSDSTVYSPPIRRIYVGATGDVKVDTPEGTAVTYKSVPTGTYINARATKVYSTGTTASQLIGEA